jgi:hypothetical protein
VNPFRASDSEAKAKGSSQFVEVHREQHQVTFTLPEQSDDEILPARPYYRENFVDDSSAGRHNGAEVPSLTLQGAMMGAPSHQEKSKKGASRELHIIKRLQAEIARTEKAKGNVKAANRADRNSKTGSKPNTQSSSKPRPKQEKSGGQAKLGKRTAEAKSPPSRQYKNETELLPKSLVVEPLDVPQPPVPYLSYGLDRVLFNPGVYSLQDPSSRVYNFDPYLEKIMPVHEFDFQALKQYKTSSQDTALAGLAQRYGKKYIGSTSSMTSTLAQFHFCLSRHRFIDINSMSKGFGDGQLSSRDFTKINKAPAAIFLRYKNGCYAIDVDKEYDSANVLMLLGKSLELLLTLPKSQYEIYRKSDPRTISEAQKAEPESYQYTTMGDFLMRSQLDAYDHRLPGNGTFDLKTRAVLPIRMRSDDYLDMVDYEIQGLDGTYKSYEREKYDMMRATMLKYMLQVRMGRMTGIFVAYHNVRRIFGFEYISLREMDAALHGTKNPCLGDQEFKASLELLNIVFEKATTKFPKTSLRLHFEAKDAKEDEHTEPGLASRLNVFAEPMSEEQIDAIQNTNKAAVAEAERIMIEGLDLVNNDLTQVDEEPVQDGSAPTDQATSIGSIEEENIVEDSASTEDILEKEEDSTTSAHDTNEESSLIAEDASDSEDLSAASALSFNQEESLVDEKDLDDDESSAETALISEAENDEISNDESFDESARTSEVEMDETSELEIDETSDVEVDGTSGLEVDETSEAVVDETSTDEAGLPTSSIDQNSRGLLQIQIDIRNTVNGRLVVRPGNLHETDEWRIGYTMHEFDNTRRAHDDYRATKDRRRQILVREVEDADVADGETPPKLTSKQKFNRSYLNLLTSLVKQGRKYRAELNERDEGKEKVLYETFGPGVVEKVDGVDSYMNWLYTGKTTPAPTREAEAPSDDVKSVQSYMDWLYGKK